MKKKKIINIKNIVLSGALFVSTVVAGLTNASAAETKNVNKEEITETSQVVMNDANLQRLGGGLIVDPTRIIPEGVIGYGENLPKWVAVNNVFEEGFKEDGTSIGMRTHIYSVKKVEVEANNNQTHTKHITAECKSCGHVWEYDKTQKCDFDEGVVKGNKTIYTCETEGCGNSYSKSNSHSNNGGGNHNGGSNDNKPSHKHNYSAWSEWSAWTIETDGVGNKIEYRTRTQSCNGCGHVNIEKQTRPYNPSHTHNWSEWKVTKAPTCTETGIETRTCTVSGCTIKTETRAIPALGHTYGAWSEWSAWTIETDGVGNKIEYRTRTQSCNGCGHVNIEKQTRPYNPSHTHNWSEWKVTKAPTCTETGIETRTCTVSGCTIKTETRAIPTLGHDMEPYVVTKAATCTEEGIETSTCSRCSHTETRKIAVLGHDMGSYVVTEPAKCTKEGTETSTCSRCSHTETRAIPSLGGHIEGPKDPMSGEIHCTRCGDLLRTELVDEEIWSEWTETKAPTCTEDGEETRTCTVNGEVVDTITRAISALGHDMGPYVVTEPAKCTKEGTETSTCSRCSHTETRAIPSLGGHTEGPKNPMSGEIHCTKCGDLIRTELIDDEEITEDQQLEEIIINQEQTKTEANENADKKLEELLNSGASDAEIDAALEDIIEEQEQAISDANTKADQQLDEQITNIENAKGDVIPSEQTTENKEVEQVIESGAKEAEQVIEAGRQEAADAIEAGRKEVEEIIKSLDTDLQERLAESNARIASLLASNPLKRIRKLF